MRRLAVLVGAFLLCTAATQGGELRVCADPNNLPFSNDKGEGFENKLAELLAEKLQKKLDYMYFPQATGFVRMTLGSHR